MTSIAPTGAPADAARSVEVAAVGAAGVCLAFGGLQLALAAGAPLGEHVWGGTQPRVLPTRMRVVSVASAGVLAAMSTVIVRRAGVVGRPAGRLGPGTWAIAGFLALNTIGNATSPSPVERFAFAPATAAASALTALVALRSPAG